MNCHQIRTGLVLGLTFSVLLAWSGAAHAVTCGDTITTSATLTGDLSCGTEPALTIGSGGSLNMNGFKVTCSGACEGIILAGGKNRLSNGVVENCPCRAVGLDGTGGHQITNVLARGSEEGFSGATGGNKLKNCSALANTQTGVNLTGDKNSLTRVATGDNPEGISVSGNGNKLSEIASADSYLGITVFGNGNKLQKSSVAEAVQRGIGVFGDKNTVQTSQALGNGDFAWGGAGLNVSGASNKVRNNSVAYFYDGIQLGGNHNIVVGNVVTDVDNYGIWVGSSASIVTNNSVLSSGNYGIQAFGTGNTIASNVAVGGTPFGLDDIFPGCSNGWLSNVGTKSQVCIQ